MAGRTNAEPSSGVPSSVATDTATSEAARAVPAGGPRRLPRGLGAAGVLALQATAGNRAVQRSLRAPDDVHHQLLLRGGSVTKTATAKKVVTLGIKKSTYDKILSLVTNYQSLELTAGRKGSSRHDLNAVLTEIDQETASWLGDPDHAGAGDDARRAALNWLQGKIIAERQILATGQTGYASMMVKEMVGGIDPAAATSFSAYNAQVRSHGNFKKLKLTGTDDADIEAVLKERWIEAIAAKGLTLLARLPDPTARHEVLVLLGRVYQNSSSSTDDLHKVLAKLRVGLGQAADLLTEITPIDAQTYKALLPRLRTHNIGVIGSKSAEHADSLPLGAPTHDLLVVLERVYRPQAADPKDLRESLGQLSLAQTAKLLADVSSGDRVLYAAMLARIKADWIDALVLKLREHITKLPAPGVSDEMLGLFDLVHRMPSTGLEDLTVVMKRLAMGRAQTEHFLGGISGLGALTHQPLLDAFKGQRLVEAGEALMDKLKWFGASGSAGPDYKISPKTLSGPKVQNDFALWMLGTGPEPKDDSTMNCWEAVLFMGYRAGIASHAGLKKMHDDASEAAKKAGDGSVYNATLQSRMYAGGRTAFAYDPSVSKVGSPALPAGSIIFIDGLGHVMLATGTKDSNGRHEVISHWVFPWPGGALWVTLGGKVQRTTLEQTLDDGYSAKYKAKTPPKVEFAKAPW